MIQIKLSFSLTMMSRKSSPSALTSLLLIEFWWVWWLSLSMILSEELTEQDESFEIWLSISGFFEFRLILDNCCTRLDLFGLTAINSAFMCTLLFDFFEDALLLPFWSGLSVSLLLASSSLTSVEMEADIFIGLTTRLSSLVTVTLILEKCEVWCCCCFGNV